MTTAVASWSEPFKKRLPLASRQQESRRILGKYPRNVPVICERGNAAREALVDREKFLVPRDFTPPQFMHVIRKRVTLPKHQALYLFYGDKHEMPANTTRFEELYARLRDEDGFLYVTYAQESTFGGEREGG